MITKLGSCFIHHKQNIIYPSNCDYGIDCGNYLEKSILVLPKTTCPETLSEATEMALINVQAICEVQVRTHWLYSLPLHVVTDKNVANTVVTLLQISTCRGT